MPPLPKTQHLLRQTAVGLQVMQLSQYNAVGDAGRACEMIMSNLLVRLKSSYDFVLIDCGLKHELLTVNALADHYQLELLFFQPHTEPRQDFELS